MKEVALELIRAAVIVAVIYVMGMVSGCGTVRAVNDGLYGVTTAVITDTQAAVEAVNK